MLHFTVECGMLKEVLRKYCPRWLWWRLRLLRLKAVVLFFRRKEEQHNYAGIPLKVCIADPVAKGWYGHDCPEIPDVEFLKQYKLKSGATVFNIGAHQCIVALILAKIVGEKGLVVAIEANAHNAAIARVNKENNNATQLRIIHAAAAERSGKIVFTESLNSRVFFRDNQWGKVQVRSVSLDELADEYSFPSVLYMDVEGYEVDVLKGAPEVLKRRPDCCIEVHVGCGLERYGSSVLDLASFFPTEKYRLFMASASGEICKFIPFDLNSNLTKNRFFLLAISL